MRLLLLFLFYFFALHLHAQHSSRGGTFPKYKFHSITKVEEYKYYYQSMRPVDSTPSRTLFFNELGQMTKEKFGGRYFNYYTFRYNAEGFMVDIDTFGLFGYGYGTSAPTEDTLIEDIRTDEKWMRIDTMRLLIERINTYNPGGRTSKTIYTYDSLGVLLTEVNYYLDSINRFHSANSVEYEYNEMNFITRIIRRDLDTGELFSAEEFKYYKK